jgi:hypothetical protein
MADSSVQRYPHEYGHGPGHTEKWHETKGFDETIIITGGTLLIFAPTALAQSEDSKKWEFFGGYSVLKFDNLGDATGNSVVNDVR